MLFIILSIMTTILETVAIRSFKKEDYSNGIRVSAASALTLVIMATQILG